eukprot:TRINITY_DN10899_c0_g1_i1.p1 TRINITY_DN10899_c0_g1~~TRINITY_DN10899_c0_g1_i1.p1  ORF type:complete len:111 (-),score=7.31 TRINITY_DN10899_c0_g1_i1:131-463(-)
MSTRITEELPKSLSCQPRWTPNSHTKRKFKQDLSLELRSTSPIPASYGFPLEYPPTLNLRFQLAGESEKSLSSSSSHETYTLPIINNVSHVESIKFFSNQNRSHNSKRNI